MKRSISICLSLSLLTFFFVSCSDWTEPEAEYFPWGEGHSAEYYENLRKWKAETKHDMAWGWFGGWGANTANLKNSLSGLPDSLYMAAIWGQWRPSTMTDAKRADMEYVRKVKGTKVVATTITGWVGKDVLTGGYQDNPQKAEVFGWLPEWDKGNWRAPDGTKERELQEAAIRRYARALADSIFLAGFDGIDLDYEPTVGGGECKRELANKDNYFVFINELGKYMGPKSGTGKLLVIDGEINQIEGRAMPYFDYFIWQSYNTSSVAGLNSYITAQISKASGYLTPEEFALRFYTTVNLELYHSSGGGSFTDAKNRLEGQAAWQPTYQGETLRKGGWGSYHIEYEYTQPNKAGFYPQTRAAINLVHPPRTGDADPGEDETGEGETGKK